MKRALIDLALEWQRYRDGYVERPFADLDVIDAAETMESWMREHLDAGTLLDRFAAARTGGHGTGLSWSADTGLDFHLMNAAAARSTARRLPSPSNRSDQEAFAAIVGAIRRLRDVVEELEIETARAARERGTTVRQLAHAAGLSERQANDRYRR